MESPKVSVIVPIYNVERYIERCVRSLLEQTLDGIEFIFVDDCSPDKSVEILRRILVGYPERCVRIVRHEYNKGLPSARNTGLKYARGEYVAHCDSDYWVAKDFYDSMYKEAVKNNADIVWSDFYMVKNGKLEYNVMFEPQDIKVNCLKSYISYGWNVVWNMLVKRSLYIENDLYCFENYNFTEDYGLTVRLVFCANKISYLPKPFYYYNRENITSIVHQELDEKKKQKMTSDEISICCLINEFFIEKGYYELLEQELSWRILKAKRGWLYRKDKVYDYLNLYPNSNKYIDSNHFCSKWNKFCQKIIFKRYLRFILPLIYKLKTIYRLIRLKNK